MSYLSCAEAHATLAAVLWSEGQVSGAEGEVSLYFGCMHAAMFLDSWRAMTVLCNLSGVVWFASDCMSANLRRCEESMMHAQAVQCSCRVCDLRPWPDTV